MDLLFLNRNSGDSFWVDPNPLQLTRWLLYFGTTENNPNQLYESAQDFLITVQWVGYTPHRLFD